MSDTIHLPLAVATRLCAELDAGENADTPESNAAERMAYSGEYMVPTKVARRLERERNYAESEMRKWMGFAQWAAGERDEAREALENHTASTIHTCHANCKRAMCVLRRELVEARAELQSARVENNHNWQAMEMAEQAFRERDAWRTMATELADAAAYGLAQWEQGYHLEVSRFTDSLIRFQKMQKEAEE